MSLTQLYILSSIAKVDYLLKQLSLHSFGLITYLVELSYNKKTEEILGVKMLKVSQIVSSTLPIALLTLIHIIHTMSRRWICLVVPCCQTADGCYFVP
jgi:hypothetical protein